MKKSKLLPDSFVIVDIETTGFSPEKNEIIEIAAIKVENFEIVNEISSLIKCKQKIGDKITKLTGITNEMLADAPVIDDILDEFNDFFSTNILLGHNIKAFDIKFLNNVFKKQFKNDVVDTLTISRNLLPNLDSHKLCFLANEFAINCEGHHRALQDCYITLSIYKELYKISGGELSEKKPCLIFKTLKPKYDFTTFSSTQEKIDFLKKKQLLPENEKSIKKYFYSGIYSENVCTCEIEGYYNNEIVISLDGQLHCMHMDYFAEMQLSTKNKNYKEYIRNIPIYTFGLFEFLEQSINSIIDKSKYKERIKKENLLTSNLCLNHSISVKSSNIKFLTCLFSPENGLNNVIVEISEEYYNLTDIKNMPFAKSVSLEKNNEKQSVYRIICNSEKQIKDFILYILKFYDEYLLKYYQPSYLFGCCHQYVRCSDSKKCIHNDELYAKGCYYKRNLDKGKIFYGENQNA